MSALFAELKRRRVLRTAALYVIAAWVALQVADLAFAGMGIPDGALRYVWIGAFLGFPLALVFAWRYQVTPEGIVRTAPAGADGSATQPLRTPDYLVLGGLALVATAVTWSVWGQISRMPSAGGAGARGGAIPANSIAVLPLQNVTGDPEQEYFVEAMHDALITNLAKVSALTVKSRSSAMVYRNVVQPVRQTGIELGAARIVEGSVFRTGDRVQVSVQLVDTRSDENLWSETYERPVEDVLTLQREIARSIATHVEAEVTDDEAARLAPTRSVNPEVYEAYARGMFHLNRYTPEGVERGLEYLREAIELDPDDPLAYAGLAQGYTLIGHGTHPPPDVFTGAREAAARALELDPLFPQAHAAMAEILLYGDWDWEGAERSFRRALQLAPNLEWAHAHYAWYLQLTGDEDGAIEHMRRATQIAPVTPIFGAWLAWLHWGYGRTDEAIVEAQGALDVSPGFPWALYVLGGAYASDGRFEEAIATHERLVEIMPDVGRWGLALDYALAGREAESRAVLAELAERPGQKDRIALGLVYAALGDVDEALRWMESAHETHVDWFPWVAAPVEGGDFGRGRRVLLEEPRFRALIDGLGLPDAG